MKTKLLRVIVILQVAFYQKSSAGNLHTNIYLLNLLLSYSLSKWSQDGCHKVGNDSNITTCHCYHLTTFASLMQVSSSKVSVHFFSSIHPNVESSFFRSNFPCLLYFYSSLCLLFISAICILFSNILFDPFLFSLISLPSPILSLLLPLLVPFDLSFNFPFSFHLPSFSFSLF